MSVEGDTYRHTCAIMCIHTFSHIHSQCPDTASCFVSLSSVIAQACLYHVYTCLYICVCHVYTFVCVPISVCTIVHSCSNSMSRRFESRQEICLSWTLGSLQ